MTDSTDTNIAPLPGLDKLDPLLQHRSRLGAMVMLCQADRISFSGLKETLGETDGNIGAQLRKLEEAGYIAAKKEFRDRKPVTWYSLTALGRRALNDHLAALALVAQAANRNGKQ